MNQNVDKGQELIDAAKNWLAIDGLWFLAIEERYGLGLLLLVTLLCGRNFQG